MGKLIQTREVISRCLGYIKGAVIDVGGGGAKYKPLIGPRVLSCLVFPDGAGKGDDVCNDILSLPFADNVFDTALALEILEHTARPQTMFKEIKRVLKPEGILILTVPFLMPYHARPGDYFRFTKEGLATVFEDQQFELIESDTYSPMFSAILRIIVVGCFTKKRFIGQDFFIKYIGKLAAWLDRHFVKNENIYGGIYAVAKNKK